MLTLVHRKYNCVTRRLTVQLCERYEQKEIESNSSVPAAKRSRKSIVQRSHSNPPESTLPIRCLVDLKNAFLQSGNVNCALIQHEAPVEDIADEISHCDNPNQSAEVNSIDQQFDPCPICGENATRCRNSGVRTCQACKKFFERSVHEAKKWADKQKRNVNTIDARRRECANYAKSLLHAKGCSAISNHKVSKEIRKCQQCRLLKCLQIGMTPETVGTRSDFAHPRHVPVAKDLNQMACTSNVIDEIKQSVEQQLSNRHIDYLLIMMNPNNGEPTFVPHDVSVIQALLNSTRNYLGFPMITDLQLNGTYSNGWNRELQAAQYEPQNILSNPTNEFVGSAASTSAQLQNSFYCPGNQQTSVYSGSSYAGGYLQSATYQPGPTNGYNRRLSQEPAIQTRAIGDLAAADALNYRVQNFVPISNPSYSSQFHN